MQHRPLTPRAIAIIVVGLIVLTALSVWRLGFTGRQIPQGHELAIYGETMGTTYTVKVVNAAIAQRNLEHGIQSILDDVNGKMSTYLPDSELSRFNKHLAREPFAMSQETLELMARALEISRATDGAYDITVGPLVNAWGFGPGGPKNEPTAAELSELRARTGYTLLTVDVEAGYAQKGAPELYCDLSSIAKGHAVDRVAQWLERQGIDRYMIEIGGEVRTAEFNASGEPWQMGIQKPVPGRGGVYRIIGLSGQSLATSGDYQNFFERNGVRYSHIIDPRTGRPVESSTASVSVIAERCAIADAYATAFSVMGPETGIALANEKGLAALFVTRKKNGDFEETASQAFTDAFP